MGNRMHVQIKHEIEYGAEGFNWEIDENEFKGAVREIKKMSAEKIASFFDKDYVGESPNGFKKDVTSLLQNFVDKGDHRGGYYHFSWF